MSKNITNIFFIIIFKLLFKNNNYIFHDIFFIIYHKNILYNFIYFIIITFILF